jgi:hypothetical protein
MMPSQVFPKHQVLNLNATVNANSAMNKSTIVCVMVCLYYARIMYLLAVGWLNRYDVFAGFRKSSSFTGLQLRSPLARHVKILQPLFPKHAGGAERNGILRAHFFFHGLDAFAQLGC